MKLTPEEKEICKEYGKRGADGKVRCSKCPLALDRRLCICKKNVTKAEYKEYTE